MYTNEALLDIHERSRRSFQKLLDHCRGLTEEQLDREFDGFGYRSVRAQLHHAIGAERYWMSVVDDRMDASEDEANSATLEAIEAFHSSVSARTVERIRSWSTDELNTPRTMKMWGDREAELVPARVVMRTQTHLFHHHGQVTAMCRLLDHPVEPGMDFPLIDA